MSLRLNDVNPLTDDFRPSPQKAVASQVETCGTRKSDETTEQIRNGIVFSVTRLDPESPPITWNDLVTCSRLIEEKTDKNGWDLVVRPNAGYTPLRCMQPCGAGGGGALDEARPAPTQEKIYVENEGSKVSLPASHDMYALDRSVPVSALTDSQNESEDPFIFGQLGR